jgi:tetratricopeptide (TPR) repeat protein
LKRYEKAREFLETALKMAPDYTSAYHALATACARLGDEEKAREYLDRFKVLKGQDEQRHRDMLKLQNGLADVRESLAGVYTAAGKVYLAHGDLPTAEKHLQRAIEVSSDFSAEPRQVLAWLYQRQGRTDKALEELAELEKHAMENPAVCLTLGQLYAQLGEFERAERAYKRLIEISPHWGSGYAALANLYLQANRKIPEARTLARKAVELEPVATYYLQLALVCQRAGDRAGAIAAIEEAVTRDPGNPEYRRLRELMEK